MSQIGPEGWNRRDGHMAQTLDVLRTQLAADGRPGKVVVWAHNSHVGDARATEQAVLSQHTLGQLAREAYGADAVLVGQTTYTGTVTAASDWGGPAGTMTVAPARDDALEALLHASGPANLLLVMADDAGAAAALAPSRLQRAIGVVYQPHTEWLSHYVFADVTRQFDALIHLDTTTALEPLDQAASASARRSRRTRRPTRRRTSSSAPRYGAKPGAVQTGAAARDRHRHERHAGPVDEVRGGGRVEQHRVGAGADAEMADVAAPQRAGAAQRRRGERLLDGHAACRARRARCRTPSTSCSSSPGLQFVAIATRTPASIARRASG